MSANTEFKKWWIDYKITIAALHFHLSINPLMIRRSSIIFVIAWILNNNEAVFFVRCDHDFVLLRPDSNEGDFLLCMDGLDCEGNVDRKLTNKRTVLNRVGIRHRCLNSHAF